MGIARSLTTGASSLRAHQQRMDVIANNISNTNTVGYKSERASFVEQFSQVYSMGSSPNYRAGNGSGGVNPLQFGLGVKLGAVTPDMSQGSLETTTRNLDLALQGDGFFVYEMNGSQLYSRAGNIVQDQDGFFVDSSTGAYLQGYNVETDASGKIVKDENDINILDRQVTDIQIESSVISEPKQTQNIKLQGNLNANAAEGDERKTSINIFDNLGGSRTLGLTFTKTANANEYTIAGSIDGVDLTLGTTTLTFNADGTLNTPTDLAIAAADLNAALGSTVFDENTPQDITVSLSESGNLGGSLTNFSGLNTVTISEQDGYKAGDLVDLSVDNEGRVWGSFTNGQSELLGQVVMAKFANNEGLVKEGGNFFSVSPNSGLVNIGTAGEIFPSTNIIGQALEQSNVDLTTEFTEMISTQRAYEAASRTVTVTDQMLSIVNTLKR